MTTTRDKILDNLVSVLQGITTGGGYSTNVRIADREIKHWEDVGRFPACYVMGDIERLNRHDSGTLINANWSVEILGYVKHRNLLSTEIEKLVGDIRKAIFVDRTRGGNALWTTINSVTNVSKWLKPVGVFTMELVILYQYDKATP